LTPKYHHNQALSPELNSTDILQENLAVSKILEKGFLFILTPEFRLLAPELLTIWLISKLRTTCNNTFISELLFSGSSPKGLVIAGFQGSRIPVKGKPN